MKYTLIVILSLLCLGATQRAGWSYSGTVTFKTTEASRMLLYHNPESAFPYEGKPDEAPIFERDVPAGKYVLTVEGYYYLDLK